VSLFATAKFADEASLNSLKASKVSLWAPDSTVESAISEKKWVSPIKHIAFTDYPVIPDQQPSTPQLVLSNDDCITEDDSMLTPELKAGLVKLATFAGLVLSVDATDEDMISAVAGFEPKQPEPKPEPKQPEVKPDLTLSEGELTLRGLVLDSLVGTHITPAVRSSKELASLSKVPANEFAALIGTLKLSRVTPGTHSGTGPQGVVAEPSGLIAAIDKIVKQQ
jgi:hypothetical protein